MKVSDFINIKIILAFICIFSLPMYWIQYFETKKFSSRWGELNNTDALIATILFTILFLFLIYIGFQEIKKIIKNK